MLFLLTSKLGSGILCCITFIGESLMLTNTLEKGCEKEIERKFLLKNDSWKDMSHKSVEIEQYYFMDDDGVTCRVRRKGTEFLMTMKVKESEVTSKEYEFSIPEGVFIEFAKRSFGEIKKVRHYVLYASKLWEIDVFGGKNSGLVLAEIELKSENESFEIPSFIEMEVTENEEYKNVNLSKNKRSFYDYHKSLFYTY